MHFEEKILAKCVSTYLVIRYTTEIYKEHKTVTKELHAPLYPLGSTAPLTSFMTVYEFFSKTATHWKQLRYVSYR